MEFLQIKKKNHEVLKRGDREKGGSMRHINKSEPIRHGDWICVCVFVCVCVFGVWGGEKIEKKTRMSPILLKCTYLDDAFNLVFLLKCNNL